MSKSLLARIGTRRFVQHGFVWLLATMVGACTSLDAGTEDLKDPETIERIKTDGPEGIFVLYDGTGPEGPCGDRAGQFAYWRFLDEEDIYIYHRALFSPMDVGSALLDLERELGVDVEAIAKTHASFRRALTLAERASGTHGTVPDMANDDEPRWDLLTENRLRKVARLPHGRGEVSPLVGAHARVFPWPPPREECNPAKAIVLPPPEKPCRDAFRTDPVGTAVAVVKRCGGCAETCAGVVCDDGDECTGGTCFCGACSFFFLGDPCCYDPECCGDTECCLDRCCQGSECCGSTDPCCDSESPCCGNPDPCCNPDNPDCGICESACCNSSDSCCNDPCCGYGECCLDRCCQGSTCCGSADPCCQWGSPCCGNPDPCCHPDNPDCGLYVEACSNSDDPCCNVDCDDGNSCTIDVCDSQTGECSHQCTSGRSCPLVVTLKEIRFLDGISVRSEAGPCEAANPTRCWGTTGAVPAGPHWKHTGNPDRPVAYVRGTPMTIEVKLTSTGGHDGTARLQVNGPDGLFGTALFQVGDCAEVNHVVTITTDPLPNVVKAYTRMGLTWRVDPPLTQPIRRIRNTSHFVYVTLGPRLGSEPTNRRLNFLCYAAAQAGTDLEAIEGVTGGGPGIHERLDADPPCDGYELDNLDPPCTGTGGTISNDWELKAGQPFVGECHHQAAFMKTCLSLIGVPAGSQYETYASTDANVRTPESKVQNGKTWWLKFDFNDDGEWDNNFEGAIPAAGRFYAVWPSLKASSECRLLRQVGPDDYGATQRWVRTIGNAFDGETIEQLPGVEPYPSCP